MNRHHLAAAADAALPLHQAQAAARVLRSTTTIRERARRLLKRARDGGSLHWLVNDEAMEACATQVAEVTRQRYPDLRIPFHSRWRHFEPGGYPRREWLAQALHLQGLDPADTAGHARAQFDLVITSVLLDAGAGPDWRYEEPGTGLVLGRSEGLGLASFHAFVNGVFSSDPSRAAQADAQGLLALREGDLARAFQVRPDNPLVGLDGRVALLQALGRAMASQPAVFGPIGRPGGLFDHLVPSEAHHIEAHRVLEAILDTLSGIWPAGQWLHEQVPLGDCWPESALAGDPLDASAGWMPFHKLSQWLTYSLLEPLMWAGIRVTGLDQLTGLPEYRNGGLFMDHGVLRLRAPQPQGQAWTPGDPRVVEWRALTVALLDELAPMVRDRLRLSADEMPLACVLEGGTWAAGRAMAQSLRGGLPPLVIASDGTVF